MNSIDQLVKNYFAHISLPWSNNLAGKQRVLFAIYHPNHERRLRASLPKFEEKTLLAQKCWKKVDLTNLLPHWLSMHDYKEGIFQEPEYFTDGGEIETQAVTKIKSAFSQDSKAADEVVAVMGLGGLFDYARISSLVDRVEDSVRGRLLVFFPGEFSGNVYRFMNARDGFNYMAIPITSSESFLKP